MKILVTGPDGVLGSNLVRELLIRKYDVSVLLLVGTTSRTLEKLSIERFYGNILSPEDLDTGIKGKDVVIHCAASTSVYPARDELVNKVNIEGSKNVADACLRHKIKRFIYVGTATSFGFGSKPEKLGKEGNPYNSGKYGLDYLDSKRKAQELILDYVATKNLPAIIVNPTFMIGPYDSKPSSGIVIQLLYNGKIPGYSVGGKNFIAVKDVANAIANAITMGRIGECYILGHENLTYKEAFEKIARVIGVKPPKLKLSAGLIKFYGTVNSFLAKVFKFKPTISREMASVSSEKVFYSAEKARKELLLNQTPIEVAIKECFDWFKANGYLDKK